MSLRTPLNGRPHVGIDVGHEKASRPRGRLVDRDAGFGQSLGTFSIVRSSNRSLRTLLYMNDWFHTLVNTKSNRIVMIVLATYICLYLIFALLYLAASSEDGCFSEIWEKIPAENGTALVPTTVYRRFARATFFSIETMMTIGYGVDQWKTISDCPQLHVPQGFQPAALAPTQRIFGSHRA